MSMKAEHAKSGGKKENAISAAARSRPTQVPATPVDRVLHLQRTIGNRAVQLLYDAGLVRAKLKIGAPDDMFEREADRVADTVMRMPDSAIRIKPT
jgi:hypothetical protein